MPQVMKQIDQMNTAEKIQTMDYLWTVLESATSDYAPPTWHEAELARREELYKAGKVPVYDWAEVEERLAARRAAL